MATKKRTKNSEQRAEKEHKRSLDKVQGRPLRLVLLDSHAILHRAYHALPDFSSSKGQPTGALYGLILMLLKISDELQPDYIVAARDLPGKTQRHELFEAYKAKRVKAEDELVAQLSRAPEVFEAFGVPVYAAPGYEADDIIGTITRELAPKRDVKVVIASGDMDTLQLVGPRVSVYTMRKGLQDTVLYDTDTVKARYGFGPELVPDLKGIMGDQSDNIPGVPGVGEGSALKLVQTFGGITKILAAIKKEGVEEVAKRCGVQKRYVQLVGDNAEKAAFSKQLATIKDDAPIDFTLPERPWQLADHLASVTTLLDELEFRSLRERIKGIVHGKAAGAAPSASSAMVDPLALQETSVAAWLLRSDTTNPSLDDILAMAHTEDFDRASEFIFSELRATGRLYELYRTIEHPLIPVVNRMNETGVHLDVKHLGELSKEYGKELGNIAARIYKQAGREFNIASPKQLATVLYDELKIGEGQKQKKTATGARTTREEELAKLAELHPIVGDVLKYRELQKLLGTYIDKMPGLVGSDGRLRAQFVQAGTTTGRMASQDPNLQNIPIKTEYGRRIREAFAAEEGNVLASLDYSQIELRIAAGLSGDERLIEVFKQGGDIHAAVASRVFGVPPERVDKEMRRRAKVINFGILYGMGVNALRANLSEGLPSGEQVSRDDAAHYLEEYFKQYAGLAEFVEKTKADAAKHGYTETLFGRRRYFPAFKSPLPNLRAQAERMAVNAPMQGTQADIIKLAMVEADALIEKEGWRQKARLVLQVHDELVYELDAKEAEHMARAICDVMERVAPKHELHDVPIVAEIAIGLNWGSTQRLEK
jgi:DNA polymerase-1